ncbi:MAG: ABC transporter permease [Deltaproteobacteria bacterium]|nr:ABC transporter permease [Deltaproteobacteria bacterium]
MERRRDIQSFCLAAGIGMGLTLALLLGGEQLIEKLWPDLDPAGQAPAFVLVGLEGLIIGVLLAFTVSYFPGIEGFLASTVVALRVGFTYWGSLGLDSAIEALLKFETHFAAVYLGALVVFMWRGGGLVYPMYVGLRYLRFKMITGISVIGVALGVAALMVVLSVMSGFEMDLKNKIIGTNAHAIVQKKGIDFIEYRVLMDKIRSVRGVEAATPFVYNEVMVTSEYNLAGVFIKGIDPETASSVTEMTIEEGSLDLLADTDRIDAYLDEILRKSMPPASGAGERPARLPGEGSEGKAGLDGQLGPADDPDAAEVPMPRQLRIEHTRKRLPGILIGKELKKILRVRVGEQVNVISPLSEELGPTGPVPKARAFRVAGVFYTGMYEYDAKSIYVTLEASQDFFGMGDAVTGIALRFKDIDQAKPIAASVLEAIGGYPYFTRTWYQMNKNLFSALKLEKVGMFIVLIIVILVSAFGIISTLIMLVWEKIKEIAILKSMGATGDGVMKIFMVEGITIGLIGTLLGLVMGWLACIWVKNYGIQLDPEVYYIEKMPVNMDPVEFVLIAGIALHISFVATIYPSRRASRLRPVEGLRYD